MLKNKWSNHGFHRRKISKIIASSIDGFQADEKAAAEKNCKTATARLHLVQANCNTLRTRNKRRGYLHQFRSDGIHMAGVQEPRRNFTGVLTEAGYIIAQSAANPDGSGGAILAVSNYLDFAAPVEGCCLPLGVSEECVSMIIAKPKAMYVRIDAQVSNTFSSPAWA